MTYRRYSLVLFFLVIIVFFLPLEIYRITIHDTAISLSRLLSIMLAILVLFLVANNVFKIYRTPLNGLLFLYLMFPLILTLSRISNTEIMGLIFGGVLIFIIVNGLKSYKHHLVLVRAFQISYVWFIFFALYSYTFYFTRGSPVTDIPFREFLPFSLPEAGHIAKGFLVGGGAMSLPRLALPFGTPPSTSMALVIGIITFAYDKTLEISRKRRMFKYLMLFLLLLCLFATMSKSGVMLFILSFFIFCYFKIIKPLRIPKKTLKLGLFIIFLFIIVSILLPTGPVFNRLFNIQSMEGDLNTHLETRLQALEIVKSDLSRFLFGVGFGNYREFGDGPHSHSAYTTILVELGILGSFSFWFLYFYTTAMSYIRLKYYRSDELKSSKKANLLLGYFTANFCILAGGLVYDFISIWPVFIVVALSNNAVILEKIYKKNLKWSNIQGQK